MRQPNTHQIRLFNDRVKNLTGSGKQILDNAECRALQAELLDVMCYMTELENRIADLEAEAETRTDITVELSGGNF
jgi:hypothetical protein